MHSDNAPCGLPLFGAAKPVKPNGKHIIGIGGAVKGRKPEGLEVAGWFHRRR
jgi:hypothetical protein